MLATYFEVFTLTLLGDAPEAAALPAQATFDPVALLASAPHWLQLAVVLFGSIVPVARFAADFMDEWAAAKRRRKEPIPAWVEALGGAVHLAGASPRKGFRLLKVATKAKEPQS